MKNILLFSALFLSFIARTFAQIDPAIDSLEQVIRTAKDDTSKVNSLNSLSEQYIDINDYEEAVEYAESALTLANKLNYKKGKAIAHNNIGLFYYRQGNYPKALENYFASLEISEEIGGKKDIANCYQNIGKIYDRQGNYPKALENYFASLEISEEIGDKIGIASTYNNIGVHYQYVGDFPEALENYSSSLKIKEEIGDKKGIASTYNNIGVMYGSQGNYPEALENFFVCLKNMEEFGDKSGIASSYNNIGIIYSLQGNYPKALENYFSSLKIREEIGDKIGIPSTYDNIGIAYRDQGNFPEARKYLNDGIALSKKIGNKLSIMLSYIELSKLDSIEGNFAQALEHYKMHTLYKDSLFNEESNKQTSQLKIQYETEKKDREIELLNKENEIKALQLNQQKVSLLASRLEAEKTQSKLLLMDNNREIQELKLAETQKDLDRQQAEAEVRAAEMELLNKDKEIQGQQLEKQKLLRNGMFAGALLLLLAGLLLFRSFRLRKKLEKQHAIIKERKRIGADLHDDVGSGLSKIILLSELVKKEAKTPETKKEAQKISAISQDLSSNISEIIWALNANNDYVENMLAYIRRYAAEYFENSPVKLKITVPDNIAHIAISSEHRRNVFYTVKEALHNIIKHANAGNAELSFALQNDILTVVIRDDGIGMPQGELNRFGNGLKNMRNRMTSIDGVMNIESHQGTKVTLSLPL